MRFKVVSFPKLNLTAHLPEDLELVEPAHSALPIEQQHFLIAIPWNDVYFSSIPSEYQAFFKHVLPYLHVRTTDVHVALCMSYFEDFCALFPRDMFNARLVAIAFILHDAGWSTLSEAEVAQSLGVQGLQLTATALAPKEKHAVEGERIAREILSTYPFDPALSPNEVALICKAVLHHDKPELVTGQGSSMPLEVQMLVDLDHLWSFTHHNFWQDTVRKGVEPRQYLENLQADLESYFVTDQGKSMAAKFWSARAAEVVAVEALLKES